MSSKNSDLRKPSKRSPNLTQLYNTSVKSDSNDSSTNSNKENESKNEHNLTLEEINTMKDVSYYKYLQAEFWTRHVKKKNKKIEHEWDNQLCAMNENIATVKNEILSIQMETKNILLQAEIYKKNVCLNDFLDRILGILDTKLIIELIRPLESICHKIDLGDFQFDKSDVDKFEVILLKLNQITSELKDKSIPEYNLLCEKFKKLVETSTKIDKVQSEVRKHVATNNELLINALSIILSSNELNRSKNSILNSSEMEIEISEQIHIKKGRRSSVS